MQALPAPTETKALPDHEHTARGGNSKKWRWWWIAGAILVLLVLILVVVRHEEAKEKAEEAKNRKAAPIPVTAMAVREGDIGVSLVALGIVTPLENVTVKTRVDGELVAVHFTEGQLVHKGDLLAEIDSVPFRAALKQSQGQLARDEAQLKNSRLDLARYQNVYKERAIPEQQVQTQEALVEQNEGTVKLDQGSLDNAQAQLDYTSIRAPLDGRVGLRLVDAGNMVHAADTNGLVVITEVQPIAVIFSISEDRVGEVAGEFRKGQPMPVEAWNRDDQTVLAHGTLLTLDNEIDVSTGTVKLKALFANAQNELFPNQFVNAKLLIKTLHNSNLIPSAAIQRAGDKAFVYIIGQDNKVANREIQVVAIDGDTTAVNGVKPGENLVTDGFDKLQTGSLVKIKTPEDEKKDDQGEANGNGDGKNKAGDKGKTPAKTGGSGKKDDSAGSK